MSIESHLSLVKEIEDIFKDINKKIDSLNDCSSQDFINISQFFKNLYSQIHTVSKNAQDIFEFVEHENNLAFKEKLNSLILKGTDLFQNEKLIFPFFYELYKKHFFSNNLFFIHYNNLRQNINTLHLFLAKQRLSNSTENIYLLNNEVLSSISSLEENSNSFFSNIKIKIEHLQKQFKLLQSIIKSEEFNFVITQDVSEEKIYEIKEKFDKEETYIVEKICKLKETDSIRNESFSNIITNLQYHDIIRQKIEHIQDAHKQAIDDLIQFRNKKENLIEQKELSSISHISEISELLSAHLLNTNKEYQNAIKILIEELNSLSDITSETSNLGKVFIVKKETIYYQTYENIKNIGIKNFNKEKTADTIQNLKNIYNSNITTINDIMVDINEYKKSLLLNLEVLSNENNKYSLEKLKKELIESITIFENYFNSIIDIILPTENEQIIVNAISKSYNDILEYEGLFLEFKQLSNDINNELKTKITENISLSNNIKIEIQNSIKNVKFYDLFEKIVNESIISLDKIGQILIKAGISYNNNPEKLEMIKKMYTMSSERQIHNQTFNSTTDIEEDDDIELF